MREWLHEAGIGEERAILVEDGQIIAARVVWDEPWRAGAVAEARLISRIPGTRRAAVRLPDGSEAEHPAPLLTLTEVSPDPGHATSPSSSSGGTTRWLAAGALALSAASLAVSLVRRRRS